MDMQAQAQRGGAPRHVPPLEEFWGGTAPPQTSKNTGKSIKSGLKTRLERFKNQKFSYPGENATERVNFSKFSYPRAGHIPSPAPVAQWGHRRTCPPRRICRPLTSENKRPKLENTKANKSHKIFDARLMRIDLIISRKAFPPLLESFSFPLST